MLWVTIVKPRDYRKATRDETLGPVLKFECNTGLSVLCLVAFVRVLKVVFKGDLNEKD